MGKRLSLIGIPATRTSSARYSICMGVGPKGMKMNPYNSAGESIHRTMEQFCPKCRHRVFSKVGDCQDAAFSYEEE